jgi:hypothetical protein
LWPGLSPLLDKVELLCREALHLITLLLHYLHTALDTAATHTKLLNKVTTHTHPKQVNKVHTTTAMAHRNEGFTMGERVNHLCQPLNYNASPVFYNAWPILSNIPT